MSERILLTGAGGFVGHHTLEHLLVNTDSQIICTDSFRHRGRWDRLTSVLAGYEDRVEILTHDLAAPFSPTEVHRLRGCGVILNMASESHVDRSISDPVPFIRNNVDLTLNMLELARRTKPRLFIQVSTDEVYGPAPVLMRHAEWSPTIPSNPYSASKAAQEAIAISYWRTYRVPVVITNTMNIIGERQDPEKFVPKLIKSILSGVPIGVHSQGGAPGSRFYLHARNQADALLFLMGSERVVFDAPAPQRWNVVGDVEVDNVTLGKMVAKIMGEEFLYELVDFHSSRPGHDLRYALDGGKLEREGWKAPVGFAESLERTVLWTLEHSEWLVGND